MMALQYDIIVSDNPFDLHSTIFSGQSFRWSELRSGFGLYAGMIDANPVLLRQISAREIGLECLADTVNGLAPREFFRNYFTFDIDRDAIFPDHFRRRYPELWRQIQPYMSLRVIRQDPFEIMVTFMCAQGIGMGLIRRQVSMIAERFGSELVVDTSAGMLRFHAFPTPVALASADLDELACCTNNNRIRAANIIAMASAFESGAMAIACDRSGDCPLDELRDTLCLQRGIGMKIADCIALFGLGRFDAFPIDTHVKQYLWEWFGIDRARKSLTERNYLYLQDEARNILGERYTGYAGHILFHCWRREVRKMTSC
ncbi:MAG: Fe-S cluster assembly protein HesB [Chlorobiaceae bacterium]|nr:Fe-S cluster assembly protein HesB [Chlorobiaceae bacterium]